MYKNSYGPPYDFEIFWKKNFSQIIPDIKMGKKITYKKHL